MARTKRGKRVKRRTHTKRGHRNRGWKKKAAIGLGALGAAGLIAGAAVGAHRYRRRKAYERALAEREAPIEMVDFASAARSRRSSAPLEFFQVSLPPSSVSSRRSSVA